MSRVLVTGFAGFIGSALCRRLLKEGHQVYGCDKLDSLGDKIFNINDLHGENFLIVKSEYANAYLGKDTIVVHLGADSSTSASGIENHNFDMSILNRYLMGPAPKDPYPPIIYASSAGVYGNSIMSGFNVEDEKDKIAPITEYGYFKKMSEDSLLRVGDDYGRRFSLRFFNVYGPGEEHKYPHSCSPFFRFLVKRDSKAKEVKCSRDFVYIDDAVDVICHFIDNYSSIPSGAYNVGSGTTKTFEDVFNICRSVAPFSLEDLRYTKEPNPERIQAYTRASLKKLQETAGYKKPMVTPSIGASLMKNHYYPLVDVSV